MVQRFMEHGDSINLLMVMLMMFMMPELPHGAA